MPKKGYISITIKDRAYVELKAKYDERKDALEIRRASTRCPGMSPSCSMPCMTRITPSCTGRPRRRLASDVPELRKRRDGSKHRSITIYDREAYTVLAEIALREGTDVSSILQNLVDGFLARLDAPQRTLDEHIQVPGLESSGIHWETYIDTLSPDDLRELDGKIQRLKHICQRRYEKLP